MKTWISAAAITVSVAIGGIATIGSAGASPQPSSQMSGISAKKASDFSAQRRHNSGRHHVYNGHRRGHGAGYVRQYRQSYALQPAYSGYQYSGYGYQPSYYGGSSYGSSFGGFGRHGFGGLGFGVHMGHQFGGHGGGHFGGHGGGHLGGHGGFH